MAESQKKKYMLMSHCADLMTIRTWKSDTVAAIDSQDSFVGQYAAFEEFLKKELYNLLLATLSCGHPAEGTMSSLHKDIIAPAVALARKVCIP